MMLLREHGHYVARGGVQWVPVNMVQVSVVGQGPYGHLSCRRHARNAVD